MAGRRFFYTRRTSW